MPVLKLGTGPRQSIRLKNLPMYFASLPIIFWRVILGKIWIWQGCLTGLTFIFPGSNFPLKKEKRSWSMLNSFCSGGDDPMFTDVNVTQVTKKKKNLTVNEVLDLFKSQGITDSAQVIRRWLREGKLKGIPPENRKAGWMIPQEEVDRFIAERNPLYAENQRLRAEIAKLHRKLEQLKAGERPSTIRSPLIWFGGKSRLAPEIIRR